MDPLLGTMTDFDHLVKDAAAHQIRVIVDLVPNHCSSAHPLFRAALAAAPGSPERARFIFRDGRGPGGELPPNNWISQFGGPAWTRVTEADGRHLGSGTCTCSTPASRTGTGVTRTFPPCSRT